MKNKYYAAALGLFFLVLSNPRASAQINSTWLNDIGYQTDYPSEIEIDKDKNIYITNKETSFITKYNPDGTVLWSKTPAEVGVTDVDLNAITTTSNGDLYLCGRHNGNSITFGSTVLNGTNPFLVKYSSTGNVLWAKSIPALPTDMDAVGNDYFYITGSFDTNNISFGSFTLTKDGGQTAAYLVKYDIQGTALWASKASFSSTIYCNAYALAADAAGNVWITGSFMGTVAFGPTLSISNSIGDMDGFVAKYDNTGTALWVRSVTSSSSGQQRNSLDDIAVDSQGRSYVCGVYNQYNIWFLTCSSTGNNVSSTAISNFSFASGNGVTVDESDNAYLTGYFSGPSLSIGSFEFTTPIGSDYPSKLVVAKYNYSQGWLWAGVDTTAIGTAICSDKSGNLYLTGNFNTSLKLGANTITTTGDQHTFLAKLDQNNLATSIYSAARKTVSLFPNPTKGMARLENLPQGTWQLRVHNAQGLLIHQQEVNATEAIVDLSQQPQGLYLLELQQEREVRSGKIMVE